MKETIIDVDFKHELEYNYDTYTSCSESGCNEEGICRCSIIENAHVVSVNIPLMTTHIYGNYFDNSTSTKRNSTINSILGGISKEIDIYTIDRILRINGTYKSSNWNIKICSGYYGQEVDEVKLKDEVAKKIETQINDAFSIIDLKKRIEYLLMLEYGSILPELNEVKYSIQSIERDKVIFGNDEHYRRVNSKKLDHYSDKIYNGIRGIVLCKDDNYRLIDGYHRCSASENRFIKILIAKL